MDSISFKRSWCKLKPLLRNATRSVSNRTRAFFLPAFRTQLIFELAGWRKLTYFKGTPVPIVFSFCWLSYCMFALSRHPRILDHPDDVFLLDIIVPHDPKISPNVLVISGVDLLLEI